MSCVEGERGGWVEDKGYVTKRSCMDWYISWVGGCVVEDKGYVAKGSCGCVVED